MVATAELIQLPVISLSRIPVRQRQTRHHYPDARLVQHRIHRKRRQDPSILAYGPGGLATLDLPKGYNVDLYV